MNKIIIPLVLAAVLLFPNVSSVYAAPFSTNVATDVYGVAQGGAVNGIPTANDDNDGALCPPDCVPDINDAINLLTGGAVPRNVGYDNRFTEPDELWQDLGSGAVALIGLTAGFSNTVGVYTDLGVGAVRTDVLGPNTGTGFVGDGLTAATAFPAGMTGLASNQNFGWFLNANQQTLYYSETALNPPGDGGLDHMMTYDLSDLGGTKLWVQFGAAPAIEITLDKNTFLIAWEDLPFNGATLGDDDYDDMLYLVTSVALEIGGEIIPIESTSLILAGSQSFSWMIPLVISGIGIGLFVVSRKSE